MRDVTRLPEFRALKSAFAALEPLNPESRRKVVEALHALLTISPGRAPAHDPTSSRRRPKRGA